MDEHTHTLTHEDQDELERTLDLAAACVRAADAIIIGAGAGMGVDSGLPDFRGPEGFWCAYPPIRALGLRFEQMANPMWFDQNPRLAWGFYGHRLHLYRDTVPHEGFHILRRWVERAPHRGFVYTSNVDGQFQRAGFSADEVVECHGSIHYGQCADSCHHDIWPIDDLRVDIDLSTLLAAKPLPRCPKCGGVQRPNILMFGDGSWLSARVDAQEARYRAWLQSLPPGARVVVIECGAGSAVPSVRWNSRTLIERLNAALIRVNIREPEVYQREARGDTLALPLPLGALDALRRIDARLGAG
jgi:NAD-dependent SIR2 family protein deacetylase